MEHTSPDTANLIYGGFWRRTCAALIDSILLALIVIPVLISIYGTEATLNSGDALMGGMDFLMQYVFPAFATVAFWATKSATPGKMLLKMRVVDVHTLDTPSLGQCIGRYLGYFVAMLPLFLGILWVAFDKRKQGWHDKLAGTLVLYEPRM